MQTLANVCEYYCRLSEPPITVTDFHSHSEFSPVATCAIVVDTPLNGFNHKPKHSHQTEAEKKKKPVECSGRVVDMAAWSVIKCTGKLIFRSANHNDAYL